MLFHFAYSFFVNQKIFILKCMRIFLHNLFLDIPLVSLIPRFENFVTRLNDMSTRVLSLYQFNLRQLYVLSSYMYFQNNYPCTYTEYFHFERFSIVWIVTLIRFLSVQRYICYAIIFVPCIGKKFVPLCINHIHARCYMKLALARRHCVGVLTCFVDNENDWIWSMELTTRNLSYIFLMCIIRSIILQAY